MYYRLEKYCIKEIVNFSRRILRYTSPWTNTSEEIVQVPSGSSESVFEQFFEENERYPVITVTATGGEYIPAGFNDLFEVSDADAIILGSRAHSAVALSVTKQLAVKLPLSLLNNETIRGVTTGLAASTSAGDDITINIYEDYTTTPILKSSGSIPGTNKEDYVSYYTNVYPNITITNSDTWLVYQTTSSSVYYVGIDEDAKSVYTYDSTTSSGSMNGSMVLPAKTVIGGRYEGAIIVRCASKNDTSKCRDLAEILAQYFDYAKQVQLNRSVLGGMKLGLLNEGTISEFTKKGIMIRSIRQGNIENRRRGENDIIFTVPVTIDIFTEYYQEFDVESLEAVTAEVNAFEVNIRGI